MRIFRWGVACWIFLSLFWHFLVQCSFCWNAKPSDVFLHNPLWHNWHRDGNTSFVFCVTISIVYKHMNMKENMLYHLKIKQFWQILVKISLLSAQLEAWKENRGLANKARSPLKGFDIPLFNCSNVILILGKRSCPSQCPRACYSSLFFCTPLGQKHRNLTTNIPNFLFGVIPSSD